MHVCAVGVYLQKGSELQAQGLKVCGSMSHAVEMYANCSAQLKGSVLTRCQGSAIFAYESGG